MARNPHTYLPAEGRSTRSALPILFFFACIISFLFGAMLNTLTEIHLLARIVQPQLHPPTPAPLNIPTHPHQPANQPLGLQLMHMSQDNPWQFSVLRTGIDALLNSLQATLRENNTLPRIVVSMTSLPRRFSAHGYDTIRTIKSQVYTPDAIYLAVPKKFKRSDQQLHIPKWVSDDPLITVLTPEVDYGPATKLIPALERELSLGFPNTRVVTIDDDNEGGWGPETLLQLFAYSLHFDNAAIGLTGWNVTCMLSDAKCTPVDTQVPQRQFPERMYNFVKQADDFACHSLADWLPDYYANCMGAIRKNFVGFVDVLEGYRGALYQPSFFDVDVLKSIVNASQTPELFSLCDDVWFSGWLSVRNISRLVVNPAIHDDASVRRRLADLGKERRLVNEPFPVSAGELAERPDGKVEAGLHDLSDDFTNANHEAVRWFQRHGAWVQGLWDRPVGFLYPSERNGASNASDLSSVRI